MRKLSIGIALAATLVLGAMLVTSAIGADKVSSPMTVHVIEHANTDVVIDTDQSGDDTTGDLLTWYNPIFDKTNTTKVGHDQGQCIRMNPAKGTWQCQWTTWVEGGSISVEGPFYDTKDNALAITGGTGMFRNARGVMQLKSRAGGTEYDFIFKIIP
jgi:allene oxide cyclase